MFGFFKKKPEPQRLREPQIDEIIDRFTALDGRFAQRYLDKLYKDIGEENLIRVQDALNRRSANFALTASGGNPEEFLRLSVSADVDDSSQLGVLMSKSEVLMRFLMGKGVKLMDVNSERGMDRLSERAADQLDISVDATKNALIALVDLIVGFIPEEDAQLILNNLSGSTNLGRRMTAEGKLDGSMAKAVQLIQETGISVPKALEVRDFLYAELDKSHNIKDLTTRIRSNMNGVLPPFF